jgi:hypothetical protein
MKTAFILAFILLLLSINANSQAVNSKIDKLSIGQLKLPKESANKALILDGAGQVKSSSTITDTELGYLEGLTDTLVNLLTGKANDADVVKLTGNQSIDGVKTFTGKLVASSTVNGSIPCPVMTEAQRDLFTPVEGDCVYNSDTLKLNVFDGAVWKDVGGAGGISLWLTANPYNVNDIIIESDKIYRCLIAHTSSVFATDLGSGNWVEVSSGLQSPVALADGGTGVAITPTAGSIVYVDADSFEQLAPGTAGQILQSNGSGAPSWVDNTQYSVTNNLETSIGASQVLLESGNKNILTNPSFEHSTFDSGGWVNSAGSFTENFTFKIDGNKSARLVLSSQTMSLTQSSVLYQSNFADGVQGLASVRVKSDVALKVCSVQAGVVSTTNCVNVQANNKWGLYKVPFILGATSNGISIASSGAVSGTVYIDDAFVGATSLTQEMNACNDVRCETEFSAAVSSTGVISGENLDWLSTCVFGTGYLCTFNTSIFTVAPNCVVTASDTTGGLGLLNSTSSTSVNPIFISRTDGGSTNVQTPFRIVCQKQGADFTAAKQLSNGNTYSSTNADTDWASCQFSTLAWQGLGTVTNGLECKRQGSDLLMRGFVVLGTVTASQAQMPLPLWNGSQLTINKGGFVGVVTTQNTTANKPKTYTVFPSAIPQNFLQFGIAEYALTNNAAAPILGNTSFVNSDAVVVSNTLRIPIQGWQQSNIIIGQFNGLESCTNTLECTDTFSAKISSAGVVSDENVNWINGNASAVASGANQKYTINFNSGLFTIEPNCTVTVLDDSIQGGAQVTCNMPSITSSGVITSCSRQDGTSEVATPLAQVITCQKQGVDYVGKTAKAVASDQNTRSPGLTNSVIYSAYVTSAGSIPNEYGDFINGTCTVSGNVKTCPLNGFTSSPICTVNPIEGNTNSVMSKITALSQTSVSFAAIGLSGNAVALDMTLMCHGVKQ